ncbi:hypothetical protein [Vibrio panuliri]|nr:hypothetical protein [Vibrio panuliri]KAB1455104.1 hypothetical protein F7O85_19875 [Vibrio panuliri]
MKKQNGAVVIMVTAVMLVALLLLVLGSYRAIFHQIKVGQNELKARQLHWQAEGALECLFSYLKVTDIVPEWLSADSASHHLTHMRSLCLSKPSRELLYVEHLALSQFRLVYQRDSVTVLSKAVEVDPVSGEGRWMQGAWSDY